MNRALVVLFASSVVGCAVAHEEGADSVEQGKIIGDNDLVVVVRDGANIPAKYAPVIDAFGKLSNGCSVTHVGNGLVITAGHCVGASSTREDNQPCKGYAIGWGYRQDKPAYLSSECTVILAAQYARDRDYAIFRVSPVPPVAVAVDVAARPRIGQPITMFGHPQGRPLEWSQLCTVQAGSKGNWGADMFSHQCDTEPGNSGSSVLADDSLTIVGIHDGGLVPWNYGTYLSDTPLAEFL